MYVVYLPQFMYGVMMTLLSPFNVYIPEGCRHLHV